MKKRKLIVTGGLAATLLLTNARASFADTVQRSHAPITTQGGQNRLRLDYEPGSGPSLDTLAGELGINADDFREDLRSGLTPKQILEDQGFNPSQIQKIFTSAISHQKKYNSKGSHNPELED